MLEVGCGPGKISIAAAQIASQVYAIDRKLEAIQYAKKEAKKSGVKNIKFINSEATEFLSKNLRKFDCAFIGGSHQLAEMLPFVAQCVRHRIVVNAVLLNTVQIAVTTMKQLEIFHEIIHVQVARSHEVAKSHMFKPIDPVYIIVGEGRAC